MGKYYIETGNLKLIRTGNTPNEAVLSVFKNIEKYCQEAEEKGAPLSLGLVIHVGERGFDTSYGEDLFFSTKSVLEDAGKSDLFDIPNATEIEDILKDIVEEAKESEKKAKKAKKAKKSDRPKKNNKET